MEPKAPIPDPRSLTPGLRVMVTGATSGFGALLVKRLEQSDRVESILGLSNEEMGMSLAEELGPKFRFVWADTRKKRQLEEVFQQNRDIDVVVHLAFDNAPEHEHEQMLETNVFGTLRLLGLARRYGVKKFVYKSTAAVYGFNPDNPSLIKEDYPLRGNRENPILRDRIEADLIGQLYESEGVAPRVVILRFCGIVGDNVRSPANTLIRFPVVPMVLGFDPMFQLIHEDDVTEALTLATVRDVDGIFNVAGRYTEPLSEVIRRLGRLSWPLPAHLLEQGYKHLFMAYRTHSFPFDIAFLKYSFAVDTRRAREVLGFQPKVL